MSPSFGFAPERTRLATRARPLRARSRRAFGRRGRWWEGSRVRPSPGRARGVSVRSCHVARPPLSEGSWPESRYWAPAVGSQASGRISRMRFCGQPSASLRSTVGEVRQGRDVVKCASPAEAVEVRGAASGVVRPAEEKVLATKGNRPLLLLA